MIDPVGTKSIFPCTGCNVKDARKLIRTAEDGELSLVPEKTEEEKQLESSSFSYSRQLTPEEEKRMLFLRNMLSQILTLAVGQPTDEQKSRIREIENELEKITGIKTRSRISNVTSKMPGKSDEEKEEEQQERQMRGIDPKEAVHNNIPEMSTEEGSATMQILRRNGIAAYLKNMDFTSLGDITSIKT